MPSDLHHYLVKDSQGSMTWMGGPLVQDQDPFYVWLTKPDGEKMLRVPAHHVTYSTPEQTAERLVEDAKHRAEDARSAQPWWRPRGRK